LERVVVTDRIGLLVGGNRSMVTLLYLWTHPIDDVSPWMAHVSRWLERYPIWRNAHDLGSSSESARIVLAAPGLEDGVRGALRLVVCPVTFVRYCCLELTGKTVLGWERDVTPGAIGTPANAPTTYHRAGLEASSSDALTSEELAFFRNG
jgi:hypothetical protein